VTLVKESSSRALVVHEPAELIEVADSRAIWSGPIVELPAERVSILRPMLRRLPRIRLGALPRVELGDILAVIAACAMLGLPLLAIAAVMNCICR
jgi:hypothetical protein